MTDPAPFTGYRPRFAMPVIAPPGDDFTGVLADFYQQLQIQLTITPSGANGEFAGVTISSIPNATVAPDPTLFALTGGFVSYFPAGTTVPSPDGFSDLVRDTLLLTTWLGDVEAQSRLFPPGTPPITRFYYIGIDAAATAPMLRAEIDKMSDAALRVSWNAQFSSAPPSSTTHDALVDAHRNRVMAGAGSVFVDGATPIGKIFHDPSVAPGVLAIEFRMTDNGAPPAYVSPLPAFLGSPYYDL